MRGRLITIEGVEGVGKSSVLPVIEKYLTGRGVEVLQTREPGGTELGEQLREVLLNTDQEIAPNAELLLMFAARAQHIEKVILPALTAGQWVLCDRFTDSSFAYQGGGRCLGADRVRIIEKWLHGDLKSDLTLLLDASRETSLERTKKRRILDRIEAEGDEFFERVRTAFLEQARAHPKRIKVIDANPDFETVSASLCVQLQKSCEQWLNDTVAP